MKENKDKLSVLEPVDERLGDILSASLREAGDGTDQCTSPEDIAALVDGSIIGQKRDEIMKHISSCDACCETFSLVAELYKEAITKEGIPKQRRNIVIFRPLALAASILIVVISMYLFFKTDVPKTSKELVEMEESTVSRDAIQPQPTVPLETDLKDKEKKAEAPTTPGKYPMLKAKKGAPASAGEGGLEDSTTKKADKKSEFYDRKYHFRKEENKVEKKAGRMQTKKSVPEEEAFELEETRERTKRRSEFPTALQKAEKPAQTAPKKMKVAAQVVGKEQVVQKQERRQPVTESLDVQTGIVDNEKFIALQKNRAWSQANLFNQQSQVSKTHTANELQKLFRNTIDLTKQLKQEYEELKKKAQKTGDFKAIDAFIQGLTPLITIKSSKNVSFIYPNVGYFLSLSAPGSLEYQFFSLARSGWCEPKSGCYDMEPTRELGYSKKARLTTADKDISEDQLMQWNALQPKLSGIFQEVARYTIENIKQQQKIMPAER